MKQMLTHLVFWHWFAFAVILGILDVLFAANFLFVWCGFAAALVGFLLLIMPSMTWEYQLLIFGVGVMASLVIWPMYLKKRRFTTGDPTLNRRGQQYIGQTFDLEEAIVNGRGKVKVGDTVWRVEGEDLPVGAKVKVIAVDGVVLKVERV